MGRFFLLPFVMLMRYLLNILSALLWMPFVGFAQAVETDAERYFEDQFYFGVTYNFLDRLPEGGAQRNLSYGLQGGIVKDIPLNRNGTQALGVGLGFALNTYYSDIIASRDASGNIGYVLDDGDSELVRNKLETHAITLPITYRWRNSSPTEYRFWRVYAGVKLAYIVGARSKVVTANGKDGFFNTDIQNLQFGPMLNVGYNTFNIHAYYAFARCWAIMPV